MKFLAWGLAAQTSTTMTDDVNFKIKSSYVFDQFLMYLIQDVTKKPTAEILNFFYELAGQVAQVGFKTRKGRGIDKRIDDYFPGTSIPFHMRLKGHPGHNNMTWDPTTRRYAQVEEKYDYSAFVDVGFPERITKINEDVLNEAAVAIMEKHLLGGDGMDLPAFERPVQSSGKMYKKLMDAFAGRPEEPKKPRKRKVKADGSSNKSN
jgi:hypothetical protein